METVGRVDAQELHTVTTARLERQPDECPVARTGLGLRV